MTLAIKIAIVFARILGSAVLSLFFTYLGLAIIVSLETQDVLIKKMGLGYPLVVCFILGFAFTVGGLIGGFRINPLKVLIASFLINLTLSILFLVPSPDGDFIFIVGHGLTYTLSFTMAALASYWLKYTPKLR